MHHIPMSLILDFSVLGALIVAVVYALLCFARKDAPYISNEDKCEERVAAFEFAKAAALRMKAPDA